MIDQVISQEVEKALEAMHPVGQKYRTVLERMAHQVATAAAHEALLGLKSSQQVADLYGVSRQAINTRAARLRSRRGSFGWEVGAGAWAFTPEEVEALRPGPAGRPRKTA